MTGEVDREPLATPGGIFGIGTDIVQVARIHQCLERYGERFAERILSEGELREYRDNSRPSHFLARRFAAKEAAVKALGTGFRGGISLRDVTVHHDGAGRPLLAFQGRAAEIAGQRGINDVHLSLSDERDHAVAFVILGRKS
jgi:holo-[acyl-carrier protein] synthase